MDDKVIRAQFDEKSILVYQAYNTVIAKSAVEAQTFVSPPFKKERMTWIKPSFLWMMYRSHWASKENQEHVLAIKIKREGFEWALQNSCLSHFDKYVHQTEDDWRRKLEASPIRIQWDPEKDIFLQPVPYRSIQVGLSGLAVEKYTSEWIVQIDDITEHCKYIHQCIKEGKTSEAKDLLPIEKVYPLPDSIKEKINYSTPR
jgi:hypothetical protein